MDPGKEDYGSKMEKIFEARRNNRDVFEQFDENILKYFDQMNYDAKDIALLVKEETHKALKETFKSFNEDMLYECGSSKIGLNLKYPTLEFCWAIPVECKKMGDVVYPTNDQNEFSPSKILTQARDIVAILPHNNTSYATVVNKPDQTKALVYQLKVGNIAVRCTITINNVHSIRNTHLIAHYAKFDQRFLIIGRVFQDWAMVAEIYGLLEDSFDIYTMSYMLIHYFQCVVSPPIFPNLLDKEHVFFDENRPLKELDSKITKIFIKMDPPNTMPVGDLFLGFIRYYGFFPYHNRAISPRNGRAFDKPTGNDLFLIEDAYGSGSSSKIVTLEGLDLIKCTLIDAYTSHIHAPHLDTLIKYSKCFMSYK